MFKKERGFTLIELIMVIVLLGLLAAVAIPQFTDLSTKAKTAATQGVVGGVRSGIYTKYAANLANGVSPAYPATLDSNAAGAVCATCFSNVLTQPISQDWNCTTSGLVYVAPDGTTHTYTPATGTFS